MHTTDQTYREFLFHILVNSGLDKTLPLWEGGILGLPSKQAYLWALSETINQEGFYLPHTRNSSGGHAHLINALGVSVLDLHATHPTLTPYLLASEGPKAIEAAVRNSSPEDVSTWLNGNVPVGSPGTNAGLSGVAGFLVFKYDKDMIQAVAQKDPDWAKVVDGRGRSLLFYVTNTSQIPVLIAGGADASIKDKSGKSLVAWWTSNHKASLSSELISEINRTGAAGAPSLKDAMVTKVFHLSVDMLNEEERQELDQAISNPDWKWTGTLEGTKREWSLAEIWKFGELAFLGDRIQLASPALNSLRGYHSPSYLRSEPAKLINLLDKARSHLPENLRQDWFAHTRSPKQSPFLALMDFLTYIPSPSEPYTKQPGYSSSSMHSSEVSSQYLGAMRRFLSNWSAEEHTCLASAFPLLNDARWALPQVVSSALLDAIFSPGSEESKGIPIDRSAWGKVLAEVPMKSPLHGSGTLGSIYKILANDQSSSSAFPPELVRAIIKIVGTLPDSAPPQVWRSQDGAQSRVRQLVEDGRLDGQEITTRWLRNFSPEVKSLISQRVLAHKASVVRSNIAPEVPKRRM